MRTNTDAPGLVIATTNLKVSLDEALFRRFDDVIELPMPDFIRGLGFEIVCEIEEGFIIVATDDVDLNALNEKADVFIEHIKAKCNSPAKVYALCDDNDRIKRILSPELYAKWAAIESDTQYLVDIGVSCCGDIELPDRPSHNDGEDKHIT